MNSLRTFFDGTGLVIVVWLCGCGSTATPPAEKSSTSPVDPVVKTTASERPNESATASRAVDLAEDSALATVKRTLAAIEHGDLAGAYEFLPPSHQSDVDGLVREFANKMDAEVWTRLFGTLRKAAEVLRTKKAFILELDLFANRPEYEPMRKHWDDAVKLLDQFASSSAADLESLKQATAKSLLPGGATNIVRDLDAIGLGVGADLARQFAGIKVSQLRTTADEHVLAFQGPGDEQPIEIVYIKHDGRWLPKSLVAQWPAGIEADRAWLAKLPEQIKTAKPRLMQAFSEAEALLDRLLAANNRDEFQQAAGPAILSLALAWPKMQQLARQSAAGQVDPPHVTFVINRELPESEQTKLIDAVLKPLHASGSDYTLLANDGKTVCRVSKLSDIAPLRESLVKHFGLAPTAISLDQDARRLTIDMGP